MNAEFKHDPRSKLLHTLALGLLMLVIVGTVAAEDWPMLGRDKTRNPFSPEKNAALEWDVKSGRNIKWRARLGTTTVSQPIVTGGLIWVGTNNDQPRDASVKERGGVLMCLRERDGAFLYQHVFLANKAFPAFRRRDEFGMTGSPMAEGNHLWFVNTAAEIICLETGLLQREQGMPRPIWSLNMPEVLGIYPAVDIMGGKIILRAPTFCLQNSPARWFSIPVRVAKSSPLKAMAGSARLRRRPVDCCGNLTSTRKPRSDYMIAISS